MHHSNVQYYKLVFFKTFKQINAGMTGSVQLNLLHSYN